MLYLLSVLLTEIKVLGISLRSPLLLFVQFVFSHFIYFVVLLTLLYMYVLLDSELQLNKSNAVILFVVTFGALFLSRVDATFDPVKLGRMLIFVYIGLSILSIMQLLGLGGSVTSLFIVTEGDCKHSVFCSNCCLYRISKFISGSDNLYVCFYNS